MNEISFSHSVLDIGAVKVDIQHYYGKSQHENGILCSGFICGMARYIALCKSLSNKVQSFVTTRSSGYVLTSRRCKSHTSCEGTQWKSVRTQIKRNAKLWGTDRQYKASQPASQPANQPDRQSTEKVQLEYLKPALIITSLPNSLPPWFFRFSELPPWKYLRKKGEHLRYHIFFIKKDSLGKKNRKVGNDFPKMHSGYCANAQPMGSGGEDHWQTAPSVSLPSQGFRLSLHVFQFVKRYLLVI